MKKRTLTIAGISALGLALVGSATAHAYSGISDKSTNIIGKKINPERHDQMQKIFETTDYQTWKDLVSKNPRFSQILSLINESNFPKFVEMKKLIMSGDKAGAEAIRVELGLPIKNDSVSKGSFFKEQNKAVQVALNNNDFSAWKVAIGNSPLAGKLLEKINESNFSQYVEMNKLIKSGDKAGAQAIMKALGLEKPFGVGHGPIKPWGKNIKDKNQQYKNK
ncbi:MAG: hypothetical protein WC025_01005 [Candidatus Magasanikbacteria bacterium]